MAYWGESKEHCKCDRELMLTPGGVLVCSTCDWGVAMLNNHRFAEEASGR